MSAPPAMADEEEDEEELMSAMMGKRRCCCCWIPWSARRSPPQSSEWWSRIQAAERGDEDQHGGGRHRRPWYAPGLLAVLKLREWSEIIAGPRWKTFIRRFNRSPRSRHGATAASRFGYDPLSYALNFDEGNEEGEEDHAGMRNFSARFVAVPASANSSMDLGGADALPLFAGGGGGGVGN